MSQYLRRVAPVLTAALVVAGAPLLAPAPATAIPSVPSLGCVTNLPVTSQNLTDVPIPDNNVVLLLNQATSVINVPSDWPAMTVWGANTRSPVLGWEFMLLVGIR